MEVDSNIYFHEVDCSILMTGNIRGNNSRLCMQLSTRCCYFSKFCAHR